MQLFHPMGEVNTSSVPGHLPSARRGRPQPGMPQTACQPSRWQSARYWQPALAATAPIGASCNHRIVTVGQISPLLQH